jgi:carboxylesterase type B
MHFSLVFLFIFSRSWALEVSDPIKVIVSAGNVQGVSCTDSSVTSFLSIPYAQPPIGDLRFASPQPYAGKYPSETYDASAPGPACIQFGNTFLESGPVSEDW